MGLLHLVAELFPLAEVPAAWDIVLLESLVRGALVLGRIVAELKVGRAYFLPHRLCLSLRSVGRKMLALRALEEDLVHRLELVARVFVSDFEGALL